MNALCMSVVLGVAPSGSAAGMPPPAAIACACVSCGRIRDPEGNWAWPQSAGGDHDGGWFSHGLCPPCMKRLYPELSEDGEDMS